MNTLATHEIIEDSEGEELDMGHDTSFTSVTSATNMHINESLLNSDATRLGDYAGAEQTTSSIHNLDLTYAAGPSTISSFIEPFESVVILPLKSRPRPRPAYKGTPGYKAPVPLDIDPSTTSSIHDASTSFIAPLKDSIQTFTSDFTPRDMISTPEGYGLSMADRAKLRKRKSSKKNVEEEMVNIGTIEIPSSDVDDNSDELSILAPLRKAKKAKKSKPTRKVASTSEIRTKTSNRIESVEPELERETLLPSSIPTDFQLPPSDPPPPSTTYVPTSPTLPCIETLPEPSSSFGISSPSTSRKRKREKCSKEMLPLDNSSPPGFFAASSSPTLARNPSGESMPEPSILPGSTSKRKLKTPKKVGVEVVIDSTGVVTSKTKSRTQAKSRKGSVQDPKETYDLANADMLEDDVAQSGKGVKEKNGNKGRPKEVFKSKEFIGDEDEAEDTNVLGKTVPSVAPKIISGSPIDDLSLVTGGEALAEPSLKGKNKTSQKKKDKGGKGKGRDTQLLDGMGEKVSIGEMPKSSESVSKKRKSTGKVIMSEEEEEAQDQRMAAQPDVSESAETSIFAEEDVPKSKRRTRSANPAVADEEDDFTGPQDGAKALKKRVRDDGDTARSAKENTDNAAFTPRHATDHATPKLPPRSQSIIPRGKSTPMSELIRRVNSNPSSPFASARPSPYNSPLARSSRTLLSRITPLHATRRTPPPPLPKPPPPKKTKKQIEREEQWEEELSESVEGWACLTDEERAGMRKAKRDREMGYED